MIQNTPNLPCHEDGTLPRHGEVWVFGSNLAGIHGAGAALVARQRFGAQIGNGLGYQGQAPTHCYAIATKDAQLKVLDLGFIQSQIADFVAFANSHEDLRFFITRVGCGLAGYQDRAIAPLFAGLPRDRCSVPMRWSTWLDRPHQDDTNDSLLPPSGRGDQHA